MSPVVGYNAYIWKRSGRHIDVSPFVDSLGTLERIPVVDAMVCYKCPQTLKKYLLIFHNALYVKELQHNLIPPFAMREAGIEVQEWPKIHCDDPSVERHSLYFMEEELRIHLGLQGISSYLTTRFPSEDEIKSLPRLNITPDRDEWNPHEDYYSRCEESMMDFEGNIIEKALRDKFFFDFSNDYDEEMFDV